MGKELEALEGMFDLIKSQGSFEKAQKYYDILEEALHRLEAIDNSNPSEALELVYYLKDYLMNMVPYYDWLNDIEKYILKAEKEHNSVNLLMQELDCKDFAELRKYARCGYERLNNFKDSKEVKIEIPESSLMDYNPVKQYLKWEDLDKFEEQKDFFGLLNGNKYTLWWYRDSRNKYVMINLNEINIVTLCDMFKQDIDFFNDLHLERV